MPYTIEMSEEFDCHRNPTHVFEYITDFSRIDQWDHTIHSAIKSSDGAIGVGSKFDLLYSMGLRSIPIEYEITEFKPSTHAVLVGRSANFIATDTLKISQNQHGCHVSWHAKIEFSGVTAKIIPVLKGKLIKAGRQTIKDLAIALEDDYASPKLSSLKSFADSLILPGLATFTKFGYQSAKKHWKPVTNSVKGQHMVVTGFTSGLGLATAHELAHLGAKLTLVARDKVKAESVAAEIRLRSGNSDIKIELADLSETTQIVELAERLIKSKTPIDVLINNAGALLNVRQETSDGIESSFSLLLLGPVILTELLKPLLIKSGSSRVINVSSGGMYAKAIAVRNLESNRGTYSGADAYARCKRGLVLAGEYWAKHWQKDGIVVHSMHPGWAKTPGVEKSLPKFNKNMQRTLRTAEQGADTIIWLASASEVNKTSGQFWLDREPHSTHLTNKTRESAETRQRLFIALQEYAARFSVKLDLGEL